MGQLGLARRAYREVRDHERREKSAAALGLNHALALERAERPRACDVAGVSATRILFVASAEGAGATTLTAALTQVLAQEGDACGAVDLGPTGALLRRLGAAAPLACAGECAGLHFSTDGGVRLATAGCHPSQSLSALAAAWDRIPEALDCSTVVVDVSHEMAGAATDLDADAVVAVLRPTAGLGDAVARALESDRRTPLHFLLNAFDGRRAADRAARAALEARLGGAFLPMVIHEDAALAELPPGTSLAERSPESQVLRDLAELMSWLRDRRG